MYKITCFLLFFAMSLLSQGQVLRETFTSKKLGAPREIKIRLPRAYDQNPEKVYPVIIVLDGDYLFEPVTGSVDYYSYWDEIPESIVIGVEQDQTRRLDSQYDNGRFLPEKTGAQFFEFLGMELLPHIASTYRTSGFNVIAGHDITANMSCYYLFKEKPIFQAYISMSPDLAPEMIPRLTEALSTAEEFKWFYLASGSEDVPQLKAKITELHKNLSTVKNEHFHYAFDDFEGVNHYSLVAQAIPKALISIFEGYVPLGIKDYDEMIVLVGSPLEKLEERYLQIQDNFGIEKKIRVNDFLTVGRALENREDWEELEDLGDLARKVYPTSALGVYFQARSYEARGDTRKAMKTYQSAYGKDDVAFITTDFMLEKAEQIKKDFGY